MIRAEHLSSSIGNKKIINDISFTLNDGEVLGIIGPSGAGKTFLLRCLTLLNKLDTGKIFLDNIEILENGSYEKLVHEKMGMVFQNFNLFNHLSIIENIMCGLTDIKKMEYKEAYNKSMDLLSIVGLSEKAFLYPNALTSSQQQRVAIARTLALEPSVILLDDPTSSLDPLSKNEVEKVIETLASSGKTMIIVSHEMQLIKNTCTRVLYLDNGQIIEEGSPQKIFEQPENTLTKKFVKTFRILEFNVESKKFDFFGIQTTINDFSFKNNISSALVNKLYSIIEEFFEMLVYNSKEEKKIHMLFEYKANEKMFSGEIQFSGEEFDDDNPLYISSWAIIKLRAKELSYEKINENGFTNKFNVKII